MSYSTLLGAAMMAALVAISSGCSAKDTGPKLGLQTWTCRNMNFDQVVAFALKHDIKYLQFIANHFDPNAPREETLRKKAILDRHGLVPYTFGVARTSMDKEENRKLFEFAKLIGAKLIVVEPKNMAEWDNLEELVKEYDIKLAIHNHGITTVYGNPATVKKVLAERDRRIGVCIDVGHVTGAGFDVAKVFADYGADRVYDIHFKDKTTVTNANGKVTLVDTEIGEGKSNYDGLFEAVRNSGWSGVFAIETDSKAFAEDPNRLVSEAKAFFQAKAGRE